MADDHEKIEVSRKRRFNPYTELSHGHAVLLENLREQKEGWHYEAMACNVVAAFKCEAVLNEIGDRFLKGWEYAERLPWRNKIELLAAQFNWKPDFGAEPLQTVSSLFRARDEIAHAKPAILESKGVESGTREDLRRRHPKTFWEELCTIDFAEKASQQSEAFAELLANAAGIEMKHLRHHYTVYSMPSKTPSN